jgi:CRISPR-associated exonuclease Cas4
MGFYNDDDLLPLSGLQHLAFCERQWALIHVEQQWAESFDTVKGEYFHDRVDVRGYTTARGFRSERAVRLVSRTLGLYGVADIVEYGNVDGVDIVRPVEYKVGKKKAENWNRLQVSAQAMCLEEMSGVHIANAAIFYGQTKRREQVDVTDDLREEVRDASLRMHELFSVGSTPPAVKGYKCRRCSLREICLPVEDRAVADYWHAYGVTLEVRQ